MANPVRLPDRFDDRVRRLQTLDIVPGDGDVDALVVRLRSAVLDPWTLATAEDGEWLELRRQADERFGSVRAILSPSGDRLRLVNVVPVESGRIGEDRYNALVREVASCLKHVPDGGDRFELERSPAEVSFSRWVGEEGVEALARFSLLVNHSTGAGHPRDEERWNDFLLVALPPRAPGFVEALEQVLRTNGWNDETASELAIQAEWVEAYERRRRERA